MAEEPKKSNIKNEFNTAKAGLNLDNSQNNIQKGVLSYALNAALENHDANSVNYQNEPGNEPCFDFPGGYKLVGKYFIPEQDKIIFMLVNPDEGKSEIGYMVNNDCVYRTLVNADCLNFNINSPILSVAHRVTNFGTEIYWADNNGRRYLDIDNIPYLPLSTSDLCNPEESSQLDCNALLLQPDVNIPFLTLEEAVNGGELTSGTYQFTVQYADSVGNPYTSFFGVTNPMSIADLETASVNFNLPVGRSIPVKIRNLNPLGQYQYFNLAVIKTINGISTPELVGTFFIDEEEITIIYTGQNKTQIQLSINDIFEKFVFYDNADYVTTVQDILVWKGMTATERINYQLIANKINLKWQSYRLPASESYANEVNTANLRGYLRDEVYAFEIIFLLKNGKETDGFHIPGRPLQDKETVYSDIDVDNPDYIGDGVNPSPYWEVYNTASVEGTSGDYDPNNPDYKGLYQHGSFAYWESSEEYPCDEEVWGELAGKKIRHHKFPDVSISPIIESRSVNTNSPLNMDDVATFPIGVKINSNEIERLIATSQLTQKEKDEIVGYRIARADRGVNKSIVAKGMLRNVGKYTRDEQDYYYPNYPYNDLNEDVFLNEVNNALLKQCKPFIVETFNLTDVNDKGEPCLKVEFTNCTTGRRDVEEYTKLGEFKLCSITRPKWISPGTFNKLKFRNPPLLPLPANDTDGNITYANYDIYDVGKQQNRGCRIEWNDVTQGTTSEWFNGVGDGDQAPWTVRVYPGSVPVKIDGSGDELIRYIRSVREDLCFDIDNPIKPKEEDFNRQIFNSPETSFGQPFLGNILKLETVMFGGGKGHHVEVKDNAKYRLITREAQRDALNTAERVADITQTFNLEAMFAVYNAQLTIFRNEITKRNFARSYNSIASYNYSVPIPNDKGIKNRNLDIKRYLISDVLNVGEDNININNYQREDSVYLRAKSSIPAPHTTPNMLTNGISDKSRFTISGKNNCSHPEKEEDISVVSYYGSIKNRFINQYGQIYSYETIDTGFVKLFNNETLNDDVIWGGDTFIGKFSYKTKVPFFIDNRVKFPDDSDIFYDEIGNIGYPKYWHSSRSILENWQGSLVSDLLLTNFISYKATNFDCPNSQDLTDGNTDPNSNPNRTFYDGFFYLFAYGIPSFYCESSYNLDMRTAYNNKEGDFWPHVSTGIPDNWVQETNVPIAQNNTYNYNVTFSKQNKETVFTNLPSDWGSGENRVKYPFRAVYSDVQNTDADNRVNNWLTYRPLSYFDFPQNYGKLTALDGLKNRAILARFENKSLLYNNLLTIDTSNPQAAFVGNPNLFGTPPVDFGETNQGYVGSQHKFLLKTPYGAVSVDAKRGHVFLMNGTDIQDLSTYGSGMHRWFTAHLPFEILKYFPGVDTDNHFNGIGLHGVFDSNYERLIITKIDYIPLDKNIILKEGKWFIKERGIEKEIFLIDSDYFCNVSWTLSFNFNSRSWISFHSYIPNWYVGENNFFYSGLNFCPNDFDFLVGVLDNSVPTTTTTTTRPFTTTTTSTTTRDPKDCDFDGDCQEVSCDLEGFAEYVDSDPSLDCQRPSGLKTYYLFSGYNLNTPSATVDSSVDQSSACNHVTLMAAMAEDESDNYTPILIPGETTMIALGNRIYDGRVGYDCTYVPDGWYFTEETAYSNKVFQVVNGFIVNINTCENVDNTTTTTTSTTTINPNTVNYCFTGTLTEPDSSNPLGGVLVYIDETGRRRTITGIWDTDTISIITSGIVSASNVIVIPCD